MDKDSEAAKMAEKTYEMAKPSEGYNNNKDAFMAGYLCCMQNIWKMIGEHLENAMVRTGNIEKNNTRLGEHLADALSHDDEVVKRLEELTKFRS